MNPVFGLSLIALVYGSIVGYQVLIHSPNTHTCSRDEEITQPEKIVPIFLGCAPRGSAGHPIPIFLVSASNHFAELSNICLYVDRYLIILRLASLSVVAMLYVEIKEFLSSSPRHLALTIIPVLRA